MPQLRHKHKGTRRKIGRKRFPNKAIKVKERAYEQARQLEDSVPLEAPTLGIVLDLGVEKVTELIQSITKDNEDAFQDAWLAILEDHVASEDDVLRVTKEVYHKYCNETIAKEHTEVSLDEPIGEHQEEGHFTYENLIRAEPIAPQLPPKFHQPHSPKSVYVDRDTLNVLKQRFPNLSYRDAIRQIVGLSPLPKEKPIWQPWEDQIIHSMYSWAGTLGVSLELPHRTVIAIRARANILHVKFDRFNPQTEWLTTSQVARALGGGNHRVYRLVKLHRLEHVPVTRKGIGLFFKPEHITKLLSGYIWDYRIEQVAQEYQQYIPVRRREWITIEEAARLTKCHTSTIYLYKKLNLITCHIAYPYQPLVNIKEVEIAHKLRQAGLKRPRQKRTCIFCGGRDFGKYGVRGGSQRYICRTCGHVIAFNGKGYKMQTPQYIIDRAMELREANATYAVISRKLQVEYGVHVGKACLSRWCDKYGIAPSDTSPYLRRDKGLLIEKLVTHFTQGTSYSTEQILATCGYSSSTKLESTQLLKYNLIVRRNGGYAVNDRLYVHDNTLIAQNS
jgi:hypothetical protein